MKRLLSCCLVLLLTLTANAQLAAPNIVGTVLDEEGLPMPGVTIRVKGAERGTVTSLEGNYSVVADRGEILVFTYIGYKTVELKVGGRKRMDLVMHEDTKAMEQVVVTGYTQSDIRKTTGSVGILTEKDLKDQPLASTDMLMQGKLAGVNVQAVSGRPGQSAKVRIRGTASITGNSEPLWVVDGVPLQKDIPALGNSYVRSGDFSALYANGVAGINPQDIGSITVLKDAAAAAIYGSQAQAGVIVITTKKGKAGNIHVNYSANVSAQVRPARDANLMNSQQKLAYEQSIWDEFSAPGFTTGGRYPVIGIVGQVRSGYGKFRGWSKAEQDAYLQELAGHTTDWFGELFRNSVSNTHHVSASGGTDKLTYYVSGGVGINNGIVKRSSSDSYNFTTRINANPSKAVSINFNVDYSYLKAQGSSNSFNVFDYAYHANPYERPYNEDGSYRADDTYFSFSEANRILTLALPSNGVNVMRELNETSSLETSSSTTIRGDITWRINDDFRLFGLASYTRSSDQSDTEVGQDTYAAWMDRPFDDNAPYKSMRKYGSLTQSSNMNQSWLARLQANYSHTFAGKHYVSAVAGTEVRSNYAKTLFAKQYGYDPVTGNHSTPYLYDLNNGAFTLEDMQRYKNIVDALSGQSRTENAFASFYGAVDYSYDNRYVANVTARSDGSNNFGAKEQFNVTWSTGLAWHLDNEAFMKDLKDIISRASVRLSCGITGGVNKSVYPVLIMNYSTTYRNDDVQAYRMGNINSPNNPHLRWERTQDWNASIDLGFLKDRLTMTISMYHRRGYDQVTSVRVPSTTGYTSQSYNTSEQTNRGIEVMLGASIIRNKDWNWSVNGNFAYNQNKLTDYKSINGSALGDIYVGYPLGKIFGGELVGINAQTGLYEFKPRSDAFQTEKQLSNKNDYTNYLVYLGTGNHPWTGGASTHVSWKNLSLSINTSFSIGGLVKNYITPGTSYSNLSGTRKNYIPTSRNDIYTAHFNAPQAAADHWTVDNPRTDGYPRLIDYYGESVDVVKDSPVTSTVSDAIYYEKGSYWKINAIALTYSFPDEWIRRARISSLSLSFTANNLWTVTSYTGLNPETPGAVYPISRSFSFGANIGF